MEYQNENFGGVYDFRSGFHDGWQIGAHLHEYVEILYCKRGEGIATVNGRAIPLREHQFIWIMPNYIHSYDFWDAEVVCAVFSSDFIPLFFRALQGRQLFVSAIDAGDLFSVLENLYRLKREDFLHLCGYLHLIGARVMENATFAEGKQMDGIVYQKVISYLSEHYAENITLSSVAKNFGYNEKYLSRAINEAAGFGFSTLLSTLRLEAAKYLVHNSQRTIVAIAIDCGFGSERNFYRSFKELTGITPNEYRASAPKKPAVNDAIL